MGFPAPTPAKDRLESFETTDIVRPKRPSPASTQTSPSPNNHKLPATPQPPINPDKAEVSGEDSLETGLNDKSSPRKEVKRFPSKVQDKIKNKIRKLKGFWKERARMMPHMFKLLFRDDPDSFELHDLSLKGATGGKCDLGEGKDSPEDEDNFELCDISRDQPFDFEAM